MAWLQIDEEVISEEATVADVNGALARLGRRECEFVSLGHVRGYIQTKWCKDESGVAPDLLTDSL